MQVVGHSWTLNPDSAWTMAWNQWSVLYNPTVFSDASPARPRPQTGRSPRLPASLPVFPQPVYPMERGRPYFEHQPVVCNHSGYFRSLSSRYSVHQQRPMVDLGLTELPSERTPQVMVPSRLFANQQRHSVVASRQADTTGCRTETYSGSCGEGDREVSGKEDTTAAASEDDTESSDRSTAASTHISGSSAMDDGRLFVQDSELLHEEPKAPPQTRTGAKDQSGWRCHFCRQTLPPPRGAEFVCHLQDTSHRLSPVHCTECRRNVADTSGHSQLDHPEFKEVGSEDKRLANPSSTDKRLDDPIPLVPSSSTPSLEESHDGGRKRCRSSNPKCAYCEQRFVSRALRDQHARQCDGNPYRCAQCGKACLGRVKLERHMRSHSRSRLSTLKAQEIARDKQGKAPDPKCAYCQKRYQCLMQENSCSSLLSRCRFPTRVVRDRHSRLCSSNPYKCPQCGKAFLGMAKLERHVRTHSEGSSSQTTAVATASRSSPVSTQASPVQLTASNAVSVPSSSRPKCSAKVSSYSRYSIEAILQMD